MDTIATSRPRNVTIAVAILCVVFIYGFVSGGVQAAHATLLPPVSRSVAYASIALGICINAFFVYKIFMRRNWARIVYLIFFLLGILFAVPGFLVLFRQSSVWGMFGLVGYVAQIVALVLLFTGSGDRWFRKVTA